MTAYDFEMQEKEVLDYERKFGRTLARISDWNTTPHEVALPLSMYGEAFGKTLGYLTSYPETTQTKAICLSLKKQLNKRAVNIESMYLYGSGTQAINMTFFALATEFPHTRVAVIYPGYFSVKSSAEALGLVHEALYRKSFDDFAIPFDTLELLRQTHEGAVHGKLSAVLITEPVYSSGSRLQGSQLKRLKDYCEKHGLLLVIDGSFSGLVWNTEPYWQDRELLELAHNGNVALIESVSKKLFFHNTKLGILYGPQWLINIATDGADWLTGNITALQQQLAICVFDEHYKALLASVCRDNIDRFKRRFEKIEQAAQGSQYSVMRPHCGYHALALTKSCTLEESDPMGWSRSLLPLGVYALPGHDFGYAPDDYFCFRISLSIEQDAEKLRSVFNAPVQRGN